jgi:hypothetical protein
MAVEEHGEGRQLLRFRIWPRWSAVNVLASLVLLALCGGAAADGAVDPAVVTGLAAAVVIGRGLVEASTAQGAGLRSAKQLEERERTDRLPDADTDAGSLDVVALEEA